MSFILDALRKIEQEKRRAEDPYGETAVEPPPRKPSHRRRQVTAMAAIAFVSAGVTAAALRLLSPPPEERELPSIRREVSEASAPAESPSVLAEPSAPPDPGPASPRKADEPEPEPDEDEAVAAEVPPVQAAPIDPEPEPPQESVESGSPIRLVGQASPARHGSEAATTSIPVPSEDEGSGLPPLVLQGTSVINGAPVAVISDRRVFEGDRIDGATVIRIEERSVELEFEGRRFTLTL